jgi:hypothetical protein
MRNVNWDRIAAASGIVFVPVFVIAFLVPGEPPAPGDSRAEWTSYALDKTKELKVSAILFGLAFVLFLWFLGSLGAALRESGEPRLATVAFGGGVATVSVAMVSTAFQAAIACRIAENEPQLSRAFADVLYALMTLVSFFVATVILAAGIASWRARVFGSWYGIGSIVVGLAVLVAGGAFAYEGFYAPNGGYPLIATIASLVWVLVTSALLIRRASRVNAAEAVPA